MSKVKTPKVVKRVSRKDIEAGVAGQHSKGKPKPKKTQISSKKAAATKKVAKRKAAAGVTVEHVTDRYAKSGHPKGSQATRTTQRRRDVEDAVASGSATIGSIQNEYGFSGLRVVARHLRFGKYGVKGVSPDANAKLDPDADKALAGRLDKMGASVKIVQKSGPIQLAR